MKQLSCDRPQELKTRTRGVAGIAVSFGLFLVAIIGMPTAIALAQQPAPAPTPPPLPKQYIFPAQGQSVEVQAGDEATCSQWATNQAGYDPFAVVAAPTPVPAPAGPDRKARRRGAVKGAAAGYIIGDLANNEGGEGAAIGAVAGARRSTKKQNAQQQAAVAAAKEKQQQEIDAIKAQQQEFLKTRTACLEAKGHTVK